jgi:hypothetical protein
MNMLWGAAGLLGLALALPAGPGETDDDLTVVKRAMKQDGPVGMKADQAARDEKDRPVLRRGTKPQWLRVRVLEKNGRKKVSVNLPLALVRALGDDFDLGVFCGRHGRRHGDREDDRCPSIKLAEVLAALDSGEDLVQVDEEDASVRVWVE